jgi:hypothetical protein
LRLDEAILLYRNLGEVIHQSARGTELSIEGSSEVG